MKVPFSWLKDYVDIDITAEELQGKLFSCGFEVEELRYVGEEIDERHFPVGTPAETLRQLADVGADAIVGRAARVVENEKMRHTPANFKR